MTKRVLVVDDEKLIVKGIRFSLEQEGMTVECAYDGEEAVEKAKEKNIYDKPAVNVILNGENLKSFPPRSGKRWMLTLATSLQQRIGIPSHSNSARKRSSGQPNWKERSETVTICS